MRLPIFFYRNNNYEFLRPKPLDEWFGMLDKLRAERHQDALVCLGLDMETPYVLEVQAQMGTPDYPRDGAACFRAFARRLTQTPGIRFTFLGDFLESHPPKQEVYMRPPYWRWYGAGSWFGDGAQKLVHICEAAERNLLACEESLDAGKGTPAMRQQLDRAWAHLLYGLCSEGIFTDFRPEVTCVHYPLPRVALAQLSHALDAHKRSEALKKALLAPRADRSASVRHATLDTQGS